MGDLDSRVVLRLRVMINEHKRNGLRFAFWVGEEERESTTTSFFDLCSFEKRAKNSRTTLHVFQFFSFSPLN